MTYQLKTECPKCGKTGEASHASAAPTINCGDCLMDRTDIVELLITEAHQEWNDELRASGWRSLDVPA